MMTQGLLTLGAIPAISGDTPHYPEERHTEGRGGLVEMEHTLGTHPHNVLQKRGARAAVKKRTTVTLKCGVSE